MLKSYPIPATTVITFEFQRGFDRSYTLQIYNFPGKKVYEANTAYPKITVSLDEYYRGVYYYKLLDKEGRTIESGRFLVVK